MRALKLSLVLVLISHLLLIGGYPLMDTTEARYADIARRMLALNDWVTPWFDDGQPFWGKPPLSFWLTMLGFKVFGLNEFGARFFYWVISLAVLAITYQSAKRIQPASALTAIAVLTSFTLFYIASVAVMTDMALVLGGAICLFSQLLAIHQQLGKYQNAVLLGLGLSIGLLAKGPLALILFLTPMLGWVASTKSLQTILRAYQPFLVVVVTVVLTLPWYVLAEQKTPGFLNYFILGEHWQRFVVPGWKGDLYGTAHQFPRGTIWQFLLTATFPWCVILPGLIWMHKAKGLAWIRNAAPSPTNMSIGLLLIGWFLTPLVLFSFAGNILWTYVLPSLPALAILMSIAFHRFVNPQHIKVALHSALITVVVVKIVYLGHMWHEHRFERKSTKQLIAHLQASRVDLNRVYFYQKVPFSARFYSRGQIKAIQALPDISSSINHPALLIVRKDKLPNYLRLSAKPFATKTYGRYIIISL